MCASVERHRTVATGLGLLDIKSITRRNVTHLADPDGEKLAGAKRRVDSENKQCVVSRRRLELTLDPVNSVDRPDWLDLDGGSRRRAVGVSRRLLAVRAG